MLKFLKWKRYSYNFMGCFMFRKLLDFLFKDFYIFSMAYSNNVFPDPLTKEEEEKCIELAKKGDKDARNKLIEHNLRLVAHIVKKYEHKKEDADDLISIGTIGLIKGVDSFSYKHGTRLTTYCARCIENEILMHFRSDKKNSKNVSLSEPIGFDKDGNEITLLDVLKTSNPDFAMNIHKNNNISALKKYFNILDAREKEIILKRYGLDNYDAVTQKEIAKEMGISRSYVSRIEKRALTKLLREFIRKEEN